MDKNSYEISRQLHGEDGDVYSVGLWECRTGDFWKEASESPALNNERPNSDHRRYLSSEQKNLAVQNLNIESRSVNKRPANNKTP